MLDPEGLGHYARRIDWIASRLRLYSAFLFAFTIINGIVIFLYATGILTKLLGVFSSCCALFFAVLSAFLFDGMRRRGEATHGVLSDELHYGRMVSGNGESGHVDSNGQWHQPDGLLTAYRLTLREFAAAMDLPLIPGSFGPGAYVILNFLLFFGVLILPGE